MQLVRSLLNDADVPIITNITPTGVARVSTITTITTVTPHGLQIGMFVQISSVTDLSFNGSYLVNAILSPTQFTYIQPLLPNATSGNGIVYLLVQGDVYNDAVLLPLLNKAYRKV